MPPQHTDPVEHISNNEEDNFYHQENVKPKNSEYKLEILKTQVLYFTVMHMFSLYGLYLIFTSAQLATTLFAIFALNLSVFGITAGSHRLWTHRSFKVTWQLNCILLFCQTLAYQRSVISWARDHRSHHKYSDTDGDPHNASRGFFFSHIGWLLCKKHPDVKEKGKTTVVSDLQDELLLRLQHKYFVVLVIIICYLIPTVLPMIIWKETFGNAFFINILRQICSMHVIFMVNSAAHLWGSKPYDRFINPTENPIVSMFSLGEGWHNYHHAFPWDYRASEFGTINVNLLLINLFAKIGWAYDLRTAPKDIIQNRINRNGDATHMIKYWN